MSSSNNTTASIFVHLDSATTDCLQSFQDGVLSAQRELGKEHDRLSCLEHSLKSTKDRNAVLARDKGDAERRVEALTVECSRIRTLNTQHAESIRTVDAHVAVVRGPRQTTNIDTMAQERCAADLRSELIQSSQAFVASALAALQPTKRPAVLQERLKNVRHEISTVRGRIAALRGISADAQTKTATSSGAKKSIVVGGGVLVEQSADEEDISTANQRELALLHEADAAARADHQQALRLLVSERDALRERVRLLTRRAEEAESQSQESQTAFHTIVNEVGGSACSSCNGPLWAIGGESGHE